MCVSGICNLTCLIAKQIINLLKEYVDSIRCQNMKLTAVLIVPTSFSHFLEPLLTLTVNIKALSHIHFNY